MDDATMNNPPVTPPSDEDSPSHSTAPPSAGARPPTLPSLDSDMAEPTAHKDTSNDLIGLDADSSTSEREDAAETTLTESVPSASATKRTRGPRAAAAAGGGGGVAKTKSGGAGFFGGKLGGGGGGGWGSKGKGRAEKDEGAGGLGFVTGGGGGDGRGFKEEREKLVDEEEMDAFNRDIGDIFDESWLTSLSRRAHAAASPTAASTSLPTKPIAT